MSMSAASAALDLFPYALVGGEAERGEALLRPAERLRPSLGRWPSVLGETGAFDVVIDWVVRACALGLGSFRASSWVAFCGTYFSLLVQREVGKRKHTLFGAPSGFPAMLVLRGTRPNSAPYRRFGQSDASIPPEHCAARPWAGRSLGRIAIQGNPQSFPAHSRRLSRGPGQVKSHLKSHLKSDRLVGFADIAPARNRSPLPLWERGQRRGVAARSAVPWTCPPRGSAEKRRRRGGWKSPTVRIAYRALSSATSPRLRASQGTRAAGANSGVCFFGYFLCTSKESNPRGRRPELNARVQLAKRSANTKAPLSRVWLSRTDIESVRPLSQTLSHKGRGDHARSK